MCLMETARMDSDTERRAQCLLQLIDSLLQTGSGCSLNELVDSQLQEVLQVFSEGFTVDVLHLLLAVMETLCAGLNSYLERYSSLLCSILEKLRAPLWKLYQQPVQDEHLYVHEVYSCVSELMMPRFPLEVCRSACHTLAYIIDNRKHNVWTLDFRRQALRGEDYQRVVEESSVVRNLAAALTETDNSSFYFQLLLLCSRLCRQFPSVGHHLVQLQAVGTIVDRLCRPLWQLPLSVLVVLQLLQLPACNQLTEQLSSATACDNIRAALAHVLLSTRSQQSRQLRNDLVGLALAAVHLSPSHSSVVIGLVGDLLQLLVLTELGCSVPPISQVKLFALPEDLDLKKQLLLLPRMLLHNRVTCSLLQEQRVLQCLLALVCYRLPGEMGSDLLRANSVCWTGEQMSELLPIALYTVAHTAPYLAKQTLELNTGARLLALLTYLLDHEHVQAELLLATVTSMACLAAGNKQLAADLGDQGAVGCLINCLYHDQIKDVLSSQQWSRYIDIVSQCLRTASRICQQRPGGAALGPRGVQLLLQLLEEHGGCSKVAVSARGQMVLLRVLECVRAAVVGCPASENQFVQQNGVTKILDICCKQESSSPLQLQLLTCLLALCDHSTAAVHVMTRWRSSRGLESGVELILRLWHEVGTGGFSRDEKGVLMLANDEQHEIELRLYFAADQLTDTRSQRRPKLFCLFEHMKAVQGEQFSFSLLQLSAQHRLTLVEVQHYLELQQCFVLSRIAADLQQARVKPVHCDLRLQLQCRHSLRRLLLRLRNLQYQALEQCTSVEPSAPGIRYSDRPLSPPTDYPTTLSFTQPMDRSLSSLSSGL